MARPSPRTQGITATGETFQKFGTQQLKFVKPPTLGTTYQGVIQKDVGKSFKGITTSGYTGNLTTAFSKQFQSGVTGVQRSVPREVAIQQQKEKLKEMKLPTFTAPDWSSLFPPATPNGDNGNGEDCGWFGEKCWGNGNGEDCGWFGEKCWGNGNGEDCGWFGEKCWFKGWDFGWLKWVLIAIGIGLLLWLLRPLFGMIGAFKGGSP